MPVTQAFCEDQRDDRIGDIGRGDVVADRLQAVWPDGLASKRHVGDPVRHVPEIAAAGDPVHRPINRRKPNGGRRQIEQICVAVDDHLGCKFGDPVKRQRRDIAIFRKRLTRPIRPVVTVDGARTDEDEALNAGAFPQPFENVHGAHEIDIDDPGRIVSFGLALCFGGTATRDWSDSRAMDHVADIVTVERCLPLAGITDVSRDNSEPIADRCKIALSHVIQAGAVKNDDTRLWHHDRATSGQGRS